MEAEGRDAEKAYEREVLEAVLDRMASALEKSAEIHEALLALSKQDVDALLEPEVQPSICPGCGRVNPVLYIGAEEGSGPIDEYVIVGATECCSTTVYAIPTGFVMATTVEQVNMIMKGEESR